MVSFQLKNRGITQLSNQGRIEKSSSTIRPPTVIKFTPVQCRFAAVITELRRIDNGGATAELLMNFSRMFAVGILRNV